MQKSFIIGFVLAILLLFGVVVAVDIGTANYESLATYFVVGVCLYYVVHGWRNTWWFAALLLFSQVVFNHGFVFEGYHLFALMLGIASGISFFSGQSVRIPSGLRGSGYGFTIFWVGLLLLYAGLHFGLNYAMPYEPTRYSVKNCAKSYFAAFVPFALFFWLLVGPYGFRLKVGWERMLLWILWLAIAGNVAIRGMMFQRGYTSSASDVKVDQSEYFFYVPIINMMANIFALRVIAPIVALVTLLFMTDKRWWPQQKFMTRALCYKLLSLSLVGAVFSGGRATLLLVIFFAFVIFFIRRKVVLISIGAVASVFVVALANIFSSLINERAPEQLARPLQFVMFDKGDAYRTIEHSQLSRDLLFDAAVGEWKRDNRVLFFGRSVFHTGQDEAEIMKSWGIEGFIEVGLQAGATHNLVTDLLVQYGLVGCVLYYAAWLSVILYFFRLYRNTPPESNIARNLAAVGMIYMPVMLAYSSLGGGFFPPLAALLAGLIRVQMLRHESVVEEPVATPAPPVPAPGRAPGRRMRPQASQS